MNSRYYITAFAFLVCFAAPAKAQFSSGSVVMHSDPRLSVLLKKNPVAAPPPTRVANPDALSSKKNRNAAKVNGKELAMASPSSPNPAVPVPRRDAEVNEASTATGRSAEKPRYIVVPPTHRDGKVVYAGKGFRVQIYNGYDREKAVKVRAEFMQRYTGMRTYFSYAAPYFKIRVGDYRNRSDAQGMLNEANDMYSTPCMIVPDQVTIHAN